LAIRQQATPGFRSHDPITCRVLIAPAFVSNLLMRRPYQLGLARA